MEKELKPKLGGRRGQVWGARGRQGSVTLLEWVESRDTNMKADRTQMKIRPQLVLGGLWVVSDHRSKITCVVPSDNLGMPWALPFTTLPLLQQRTKNPGTT